MGERDVVFEVKRRLKKRFYLFTLLPFYLLKFYWAVVGETKKTDFTVCLIPY